MRVPIALLVFAVIWAVAPGGVSGLMPQRIDEEAPPAATGGGAEGPDGPALISDFCSAGDYEEVVGDPEESRWSIFDQLASHELWDVVNFMVEEMGYFHIRNATWNSTDEMPTPKGPNYLYRVELLEPPKDEALAYLDGTGPRPPRFAKATVIRPKSKPKDIMEFKVGPLPLAPPSKKKAKKNSKNLSTRPGVTVEQLLKDGEIPFTKRPTESIGVTWAEIVISRVAYQLREIFIDSVGFCYGHNDTTAEIKELTEAECGRGIIEWLQYPALDKDETKRYSHIHWFFQPRRGGGEEMELHAVPLSFKLDETEDDIDKWKTFDFEYCHQGPFESPEALLKAYDKGEIAKCPANDWKDPNYDERWSQTNNRVRFRPGTNKASPRTFEPEGRRFEVRGRTPGGGHHFEYLGWEGHLGMRYDTGIIFHDIRFRGNRIAYEVSLQDQYVAYSGYSGGGQVVYFDSYFGIGINSMPLRHGLDCPETAEYLSATKMHLTGQIVEDADIICMFEEDGQTTEWRHTHTNGSYGAPHLDAVRRSALVVRTIATIGNYDYIYNVRFKPDASIEVEVVMAGYMETTYFGLQGETVKDLPFGTRVYKHTFANLHDHLSGWKVDLDVLGTKNSVHKHEVKAGTWEEALKNVDPAAPPPGWHASPVVKYIESSNIDEEFGFKIKNPGTTVYAIANDLMTNRWGQPRGYAIVHGMTSSQLLPDSHPFTKAAAWTKYHLAVTKRKEEEPRSHAGIYDMPIPQKPFVSLDDFLDDEKIADQDLVAWVMMGVNHVPRSEDVPLISNFGTKFYIKPWNYYEELVSMDIGDHDRFSPCAPRAGKGFEYSWAWDPTEG